MEKIIYQENQKPKKYSWQIVLITNLLLILGLYFFIEDLNFSTSIIPGWHITVGIMGIMMIATLINFLLIFISLFFYKKYWYKWLAMTLIGVFIICIQSSAWIDFFNLF